jgi:hypothetical protein
MQNPTRKHKKVFPTERDSITRHVISPHCAVIRGSEIEPQKPVPLVGMTRGMKQYGLS